MALLKERGPFSSLRYTHRTPTGVLSVVEMRTDRALRFTCLPTQLPEFPPTLVLRILGRYLVLRFKLFQFPLLFFE
jgi:hypothetical protein